MFGVGSKIYHVVSGNPKAEENSRNFIKFLSNSNLIEFEIPDDVEYFCPNVSQIRELVVPATTKKCDVIYISNSLINKITIKEGADTITNDYQRLRGAFTNLKYLKDVILPSTFKVIESYMFRGCVKLENINLPEGLTKIKNQAFRDCEMLSNVVIPDSVTELGEYSFSNCKNMQSLKISSGVKIIPPYCFENLGVDELVIPDSVEDINDRAFANNQSANIFMSRITIGSSVKTIGDYAFYHRESDVPSFPQTLTSIGNYAFGGIGIVDLVLSSNITSLGDACFTDSVNMKSAVIEAAVSVIPREMLKGCMRLESVELKHMVQSISNSAFAGCVKLKSFKLYQSNPPVVNDTVFSGVTVSGVNLLVPSGSLSNYSGAEVWNNFNIIEY